MLLEKCGIKSNVSDYAGSKFVYKKRYLQLYYTGTQKPDMQMINDAIPVNQFNE